MSCRLVILLAMSLFVAACGGDGTEESASTGSAEAQTDAGTEPSGADASTQPAAGEEPVVSGEEGTGTATIGNTTWEFSFIGGGVDQCDLDVNDAGILFVVIMYGIDDEGREIALNVGGRLSGGDLAVQVGSPTQVFERWTADSSVYDRLSGIEGMPEGVTANVQVDGNTVSGSGVFYDATALDEARFTTGAPYDAGVLEGTFSVTCPAS